MINFKCWAQVIPISPFGHKNKSNCGQKEFGLFSRRPKMYLTKNKEKEEESPVTGYPTSLM